jgi:hypothetical protein
MGVINKDEEEKKELEKKKNEIKKNRWGGEGEMRL